MIQTTRDLDEDRCAQYHAPGQARGNKTPTRSGQILGTPRGIGSGGPTFMGLAWSLAGVGACHPTSLFGRLGLMC